MGAREIWVDRSPKECIAVYFNYVLEEEYEVRWRIILYPTSFQPGFQEEKQRILAIKKQYDQFDTFNCKQFIQISQY